MIKNEIFFPIRYNNSRPFVKNWIEKYKDKTPQQIQNTDLHMNIQNDLFNELEDAERRLHVSKLPDQKGFERRLSQELNYFFFHNYWNQKGKNIFYFTPELLQLLQETNVNDIPYESLKFPFSSFYISSYDAKIEIGITTTGEKIFLDGILVTNNLWKENQIDLRFCTYFENASKTKNWYTDLSASIHGFWFRLNFDKADDTIQEAKLYAKDFDDKLYSNNELEKIDDFSIAFFNEQIRLVINSICYLSSEEVKTNKEQFPIDTPTHLLEKYENAKTKHKKEIAENELKRNGFSKIKLCGLDYKRTVQKSNSNGVATHWRRGFWRNQAIGTGLKEHRLIWIKPTIVRGDKGDPEHGHIYTN